VLILAIFDLERNLVLETNVLDKAISRCLRQRRDNNLLYLIAYYLQKLILAKLNYNVYNKELLAIIDIIEY
jgi:hypothetical protein